MTVLLSLPHPSISGRNHEPARRCTGQREPVPTGTLIGAVRRPGEDDRRKRVSDVSDIGASPRGRPQGGPTPTPVNHF